MALRLRKTLAVGALSLAGLAVAVPAVAAAGGPDVAGAVGHRAERIKDALSGLVTDGTLDQAQADRVAETLAEAGPPGRGPGGPGGFGFGADIDAVTELLGTSREQLRTALRDGSTLGEIATSKSVAVDELISTIVEAERARIAQRVTDGELTQEQADRRLADLTARVTERVEEGGPLRGPGGGPGGPGGGGPGASTPEDAPEDAPAPEQSPETPAPTPS